MIKHLISLKIKNMIFIIEVLASMVYKVFDKKPTSLAGKSAFGRAIKKEIISNKKLAKELHKPIIRKRKVYSSFIDNIWSAYLADM